MEIQNSGILFPSQQPSSSGIRDRMVEDPFVIFRNSDLPVSNLFLDGRPFYMYKYKNTHIVITVSLPSHYDLQDIKDMTLHYIWYEVTR